MNQEKNTEKSFSKEKARSAYKAIKTGAIPILEAFKDDLLVHDKREITQDFPGRPFLHFTRKNGTHILMLYCLTDYPKAGERVKYIFADADRDHILSDHCGMINTLEKMNTVRKIQYCNYDGEVRDVSFSEAHEIVKEYLKAMNDLFKKYN